MIHRDIKLDNILINKIAEGEYNVKIADFGLAMEIPKDESALIYQVCGTPSYIAPEILRNEGCREKCDIFSMGSIFFNLLTGRYLYNGKNNDDILAKNKQCDIEITK